MPTPSQPGACLLDEQRLGRARNRSDFATENARYSPGSGARRRRAPGALAAASRAILGGAGFVPLATLSLHGQFRGPHGRAPGGDSSIEGEDKK